MFFGDFLTPSVSFVLHARIMVSNSASVVLWYFHANLSVIINRLSVIDGYKSTISNIRKDNCFLFSKLLNHRMTSFVLLHWSTSALHLIDMLSTMFLLTLTISGIVGLIRRHLVLLAKFSLWSFIYIYTCKCV